MALAYTANAVSTRSRRTSWTKWEHALEALRAGSLDGARHAKVDWVMKKAMIESFMERKGLDWSSPQVEMLDLQYHDLRPEKGLYYLLERQGRAERIVTDEEILAAVHTPPPDTRAYFRGECLKKYGSAVFGVNWDSISFGVDGEPIKRILMAEPLKGTKAHVQELLDSSPTWPPSSSRTSGPSPRETERRPGSCASTPRLIATRVTPTPTCFPSTAPPRAARSRHRRGGGGDSGGEGGEGGSQKLAKKGEELKDEMDALVDEIDEVFEENAEEFVKNYVQRGGE